MIKPSLETDLEMDDVSSSSFSAPSGEAIKRELDDAFNSERTSSAEPLVGKRCERDATNAASDQRLEEKLIAEI